MVYLQLAAQAETCAICLETNGDLVSTHSLRSHLFHKECLHLYVRNARKDPKTQTALCPTCRLPISATLFKIYLRNPMQSIVLKRESWRIESIVQAIPAGWKRNVVLDQFLYESIRLGIGNITQFVIDLMGDTEIMSGRFLLSPILKFIKPKIMRILLRFDIIDPRDFEPIISELQQMKLTRGRQKILRYLQKDQTTVYERKKESLQLLLEEIKIFCASSVGDQEKVTEFKHWLGEVLDSKNDHLKRKAAFMVRAFKARGVLLYYALKKDVTMLDLPLAQKLNNFGFFVWLIIMDAEASSNAEFWKF